MITLSFAGRGPRSYIVGQTKNWYLCDAVGIYMMPDKNCAGKKMVGMKHNGGVIHLQMVPLDDYGDDTISTE